MISSFYFQMACLFSYFIFGWVHSYLTNKYSWVDYYWASSFLILVGFNFYNLFDRNLYFLDSSFFYLLVMYFMWSLRLSFYLFFRIKKMEEDSRYKELIKYFKKNIALKFFGIFLFEGILTLVVCTPIIFYKDLVDKDVILSRVSIFLYLIGIVGVSLSDFQMSKFKENSNSEKKVCNVGLWKYSRHPNYFFELVLWFSISLYAFSITNSWFAGIPFFIMFIFITRVTGVPYSEAQSLRSRGDLYREYQRTTNCLVPWFPKRKSV